MTDQTEKTTDPLAVVREEIGGFFAWIEDHTKLTREGVSYVTVDRRALANAANRIYMKAYKASGIGGVLGYEASGNYDISTIVDIHAAMLMTRMPLTPEHVEAFDSLKR